jgi:hypothetical protein
MSFLGSGAPKSNEDIKTALLQQVQQEAAMNNARALIGVRHRFTLELVSFRLMHVLTQPDL